MLFVLFASPVAFNRDLEWGRTNIVVEWIMEHVFNLRRKQFFPWNFYGIRVQSRCTFREKWSSQRLGIGVGIAAGVLVTITLFFSIYNFIPSVLRRRKAFINFAGRIHRPLWPLARFFLRDKQLRYETLDK